MEDLIMLIAGLFLLTLVYVLLIGGSITNGRTYWPYCVLIALHILMALYLRSALAGPHSDPQWAMGLGLFFIVFGLANLILPLIGVLIYFLRK